MYVAIKFDFPSQMWILAFLVSEDEPHECKKKLYIGQIKKEIWCV